MEADTVLVTFSTIVEEIDDGLEALDPFL